MKHVCGAKTILLSLNSVVIVNDAFEKLFMSFVWVPLILLMLSCFSLPLSAAMDKVVFENFSGSVTLELQNDGFYRKQGSALQVQLAPRLIVKTVRSFTTAELTALAPDATHITDLFLMNQQRYFLMHFAHQIQALEALEKLQQHPSIRLVQPDLQQKRSPAEKNAKPIHQLSATSPLPDYLRRAQKKGLWPGRGGEGLVVAVIDDGFRLQHPEFAQLQTDLNYDFSSKQLITTETPKNKKFGQHGTKVAGILFALHNQQLPEGLVPKAHFVGIAQADTWTSQTLQSFYMAYLAKADVINCSWHSQWLLEPVQDVVDELSRYGREGKGIAVVFAAGNEGKLLALGMHEASMASAIVVGTTDIQGRPLKTSNFGEGVDIWVSGEKIKSTDARGSYSYFSGTSLSAAIISGYIALLISTDPSLDLTQIQSQLTKTLQ